MALVTGQLRRALRLQIGSAGLRPGVLRETLERAGSETGAPARHSLPVTPNQRLVHEINSRRPGNTSQPRRYFTTASVREWTCSFSYTVRT